MFVIILKFFLIFIILIFFIYIGNSSLINRLKLSERAIITNINKKDGKNKHKKNLNKKREKKLISYKIRKSKKKNKFNKTTQGIEQTLKEENKKNNYIELNLININLNNINKNYLKTSNHILNIYSFKEAIKNDMRSVLRIFYIYLLTKQAFLHAFLYRSPILLFPKRFCFFFLLFQVIWL